MSVKFAIFTIDMLYAFGFLVTVAVIGKERMPTWAHALAIATAPVMIAVIWTIVRDL